MARWFPAAALLLLAALASLAQAHGSGDVVGCGGFVEASSRLAQLKSSTDGAAIDFSSVKVKIVTNDGVVKSSTECSPSGYYFLPVYDKGQYLVKVEGPDGWAFEPGQVSVTIGDDNMCNDGKDINFLFTGFTLSGRVTGVGECAAGAGPAGVSVSLHRGDQPQALATAQTGADGTFSFFNLFPDTYKLAASHASWKLLKDKATVTMTFGNAEIKEPFLVSGFDVSGKVVSNNEPMTGVEVFLYSDKGAAIEGCAAPSSPGPIAGKKAVCVAKSDASGKYAFSSVPCGQYSVAARYSSAYTNFEIEPASLPVSVRAGSVQVAKPFSVVGFSIGGRVVLKAGGAGVAGASVLVDGQQRATTDANGAFMLEKLQAGSYTIDAKKENIVFAPLTKTRVVPSMASLPDVVASGFSVCGRLAIDKAPSDLGSKALQREVVLRKPDGGLVQRMSDDKGRFCFEGVAPGAYAVYPTISAAERQAGLALYPAEREVTVADAPVLNADFSQSRVTVSGKVSCIEKPCAGVSVTLTRAGGSARPVTARLEGDDSFKFAEVLPGTYQLSASQDAWCWDKQALTVEVGNKDVADVALSQKGYAMSLSISHDASVALSREGASDAPQTLQLKRGQSQHCVPRAGAYKLEPRGCYKFDKESYRFDTARPRLVEMEVSQYLLTGSLVPAGGATAEAGAVQLTFKSSRAQSDGTSVNAEVADGKYTYTYWASLGETVEVVPKSKSLLFYPKTRTASVTKAECQKPVEAIECRPGVFLKGKVAAVAGVEITVTSETTGDVVARTTTDASGAYAAGPLYDDQKYKVSAFKDGYAIEEDPSAPGRNFVASRLGSVQATVTEGGEGVSGVLLSLSSRGFRSNNVTLAGGQLTFLNLAPGEYYLKPALKEYVFTPAAATITVGQGEAKTASFAASRTQYSVFGVVRSLNGDAEKAVAVEAVGPKGEIEEALTDAEGAFRVRGLDPGKTYTVRVRAGDANARLERASPSGTTVTVPKEGGDSRGLEFVAFRRINKFDLTGVVEADPALLPTLTAEVASESSPEVALKQHPMGLSSFFEFSSLPKDRFVVRVRSTLSTRQFDVRSTEALATLGGEHGSAHVRVQFEAKPKAVSQDVANASFLSLFFFAAVAAAAFYREQSERLAKTVLSAVGVGPAERAGAAGRRTPIPGSKLQLQAMGHSFESKNDSKKGKAS